MTSRAADTGMSAVARPQEAGGVAPAVPSCPRCWKRNPGVACSQCGLVLACPRCGVAYDDPLKQRVCGSCYAPLPAAPAWTAEHGEDGESDTPAATGPPAVALPPVAELLKTDLRPGVVRQTGLSYALALVAEDRCGEADELLGRLIAETGSEPSTAKLLALRAYVAERRGDAQQAVQHLLETASEEPDWLALAAGRARALLAAPNAGTARSWLAGSGGAPFRALRRLAPEADLLTIQAAVLSYDGASADSALAALSHTGPPGKQAARTVLAELAGADLDGRQHLLVGQLYWDLGDTPGALDQVDRALALDLPEDPGRFGQAAAFRLRGEARQKAQARDDAAMAYLEAGKHYAWSGDPHRSVRMLKESLACGESADALIYLSESLRQLAADLPEKDRRQPYQQALDVWRRGIEILDGSPATWVLESGVMIIDELATIETDRSRELYWVAILVEEEGLAADAQSGTLWAFLSMHHRCLENFSTALHAADRARAVEPDSPVAIVQHIAVELEIIRPTLVESTAGLPSDLGEELQALFRAFALMLTGQLPEAIETLAPFISKMTGPVGRSARYLLASMLERVAQREAAEEHWRVLWRERNEDSDTPTTSGVAAAGFWLGEYAETEQLLRRRLAKAPLGVEDTSDITGFLAAVLLPQGRCDEAAENVERAFSTARSPYRADELATYYVELSRRLARIDQPSAVLAEEWAKSAGEIKEALRSRPYDIGRAMDELQLAERHAIDFGTSEHTVRAAAQAGLARLLAEAGRNEEALEVLAHLVGSPAGLSWLYPQLGLTAEKVGQSLLRSGRREEAAAKIEHVLATSSAQLPSITRAELNAMLALAQLLGASSTEAAAKSMAIARQNLPGDVDADGQLARWWRRCLVGRQDLWRIADRIGDDGAATFSGPLWRCHSLLLGLSGESEVTVPTPLPIVLEISQDLVPEDTSATGPLIGTALPAMRDRIQADTGVWVPGVRVRVGSDLASRAFRMWIYESDFSSGELRANSVFCPRPPSQVGVPSADPARHPVTGATGCWLPAELVDKEGRHRDAWEDPLEYVLTSLERHVRNHLDCFLNSDQLVIMTAGREGYGMTPVRIRLGRLLRDLATQQVPLNDMDSLLSIATPAALMASPLPLLADRCRAALRYSLPGNTDSDIREAVPSAISHDLRVACEEGAVPPAVALSGLHAMAKAAESGHVLVASTSAARRLLHWLGGRQFPEVALLSADEAVTPMEEEPSD